MAKYWRIILCKIRQWRPSNASLLGYDSFSFTHHHKLLFDIFENAKILSRREREKEKKGKIEGSLLLFAFFCFGNANGIVCSDSHVYHSCVPHPRISPFLPAYFPKVVTHLGRKDYRWLFAVIFLFEISLRCLNEQRNHKTVNSKNVQKEQKKNI